MNEQRFIKQVRQYSRLAAATKQSYADIVKELLMLRRESIVNEMPEGFLRDNEMTNTDAFVMREYGSVDSKYVGFE